MNAKTLALALCLATPAVAFLGYAAIAKDAAYQPADDGNRPAAGVTVLPERFLRGWDPVTVYLPQNVGPGRGPADDPKAFVTLSPSWPGAWSWLDQRTLQFKPAEPWPALHRFAVTLKSPQSTKVLSTMMAPPLSLSPPEGSDALPPFRSVTLTFPQALPLDSLRRMLTVEVRELPGLADSPRVRVERFGLIELPRGSAKDPATYVLTLDDEVGESRQLVLSLALSLGEEGKALWSGRLSTRTAFSLVQVTCGSSSQNVGGAPTADKEAALDCGNRGDVPQLVFSAPVKDLSLSALKKLVRLEPAVEGARFQVFGKRVQLEGQYKPDTLYRLRLADAPIVDEGGRRLRDPGDASLHFFLGWKRPFLKVLQGNATLEQNGPRMVPVQGYGDARADVRIHKIAPLHPGLWPFPDGPLVVDEQQAPPFPGEEPALPAPGATVSSEDLPKHLRLLGSPLVSRVFELPLADRAGATRFGLDIGAALDAAVGARVPGTYLVGVRRLGAETTRSWVRVQVTNLSLTAAEERGRAVFFVRSLDRAAAVAGARVTVEAIDEGGEAQRVVLTTDAEGRADIAPRAQWRRVHRISVEKGDDALVLDPRSAPPRFFSNHWSPGNDWLSWLTEEVRPSQNDRTLGFVFSERPIYRPGETVHLKGYLRDRKDGRLVAPTPQAPLSLVVQGPGGQQWALPTTMSALVGASADFVPVDPPTGDYQATLMQKDRVLARRSFKIEAYRIPTFEVQMSAPATARLDQPFKVKALARYYAGGNVANEAIRWTVTRRPHWHMPQGREGYLFASSNQFARPDSRPKDERSERVSTLDGNGADLLEINPQKDLDGSPRIYRIEATVTGADNQEVTTMQEVRALPPFVLGLKLPRFSNGPLTLTPDIIAVGPDDKLLSGQAVSVRLYKRNWHSHLRESHFASGQASYVTEQEDVRLKEVQVTTTAAPVQTTFTLPEAGVYVVELSARDKLGRVQTLSADLYVGGKQPVAWQKAEAGVFELAPDKPKYLPGQVANIVVKSPFTKAQALVIVEEPAGNRYSFVNVEAGAATVRVPVSGDHVPNLPVHVVLLRGRLGDSATDDAPWRPQSAAASVDLEVEPTSNRVVVNVGHPDTARPGQKLDLTVSLKDSAGQPLAGEVTLWLVDEAVLSLAPEEPLDPLSAFVVRNARTTSVSDTRNSVIGRLIDEESPGGDGGREGDNDGAQRRRVRKNFQTVPYYAATLQVPQSGKLVVPVQLSDDLTNFMVRAVAASGMMRFGHVESRLRVRLPVLVQPQLPRFVRQGDRFMAGGVARLVEGAQGKGKVTATVSGQGRRQEVRRDVELTLDKAQSVTFPVEVQAARDASALSLRMEVTRQSDGVGDAFEVTLPVLPDRAPQTDAHIVQLPVGSSPLPAFREAPRAGTLRQTVAITAVPGVFEMLAALDYVQAYPHGCLEQKLARLRPPLALRTLHQELDQQLGGLLGGRSSAQNTQRFLDELALHQAEDGLFGFWPGSAGDVQLTGEVLSFVGLAEKSGSRVDAKVKERAITALRRALRSDYQGFVSGYRTNAQTVAVRGLAAVGEIDDNYLTELMKARRELDATSVAELALALLTRGPTFIKDTQSLKADLWDMVVFERRDGRRVVAGVRDRRSGWGSTWLGSSTSTLAAVMEALLRVDPTNPDHELLFQALLVRTAVARGFGSTYDSDRAIRAIALFLARASLPKQTTTVALSPATSPSKAAATLTVDGKKKVAVAAVDSDAPHVARITGAGVGARVVYSYLPQAPGDRVGAERAGLIVSRSMSTFPRAGGAPLHQDDVKGGERELAVGDVVELHVQVTTELVRHNVALVLPFAAGLEPLNPNLKGAPAEATPSQRDSLSPWYVARLDDEVRYYFRTLDKGTHTFHVRLRAATPGSYVHPAPHAALMYDEAVRGRGDGMRVIVSPTAAP